ncbi:MAG: hypothetical protein BGO30_08460 [Bacteroidetes bacterium 41-46]|nr:MAG: hypothetical protein BGO30_08460 [Bacteroidetes bacterium 41-46]
MKKEIFEALKTKFPGVQDAILDRIATKMAKTVTKEEDVTTSVEGVTFQNVLESYGDHRATESQVSAVTNYEKKHGLKDGAKVQKEPGAGGDSEPGESGGQPKDQDSELAKTVKGLQEKIEKLEGEKATEGRLQKFTKSMEKAPEKIRDRYRKDFNRLNFKDDAEFDEWLKDVDTDVDAIAAEYSSKGVAFQPPKGTNKPVTQEQASPEVKARIESRKAETGAPAIQGLPTQKV